MELKLTLHLEESVIDKAKEYASTQKRSLSDMIETYIKAITSHKNKGTETTPLVESLCGVIDIAPDFDYKTDYYNYLNEKYK